MGDLRKKKTSISNSVNYTIGGKKYSANDLSYLKPSKTGNTKTATDISRESKYNIQSQMHTYQKTGSDISKSGIQSEISSTPKLVDAIKTSTEQPKPNTPQYNKLQATPYTSHTMPKSHTTTPSVSDSRLGSLKTESSISLESKNNVQSQMDAYQKTGSDILKSDIQSKISSVPKSVDTIKTSTEQPKSNTSQYNKLQATPYTSHIIPKSHTTISPVSGSRLDSLKTESSISLESKNNVKSQMDAYQKTGSDILKSDIQSKISSTPKSVDAIKTSTEQLKPNTFQYNKLQATAYTSHIILKPYTTTPSVSGSRMSSLKTESNIIRKAVQNVQSQTTDYYKTGVYALSQSEIVKTEVGQFSSIYRPQTQIRTGYAPQEGVTTYTSMSSPYLTTGNVKTQSEINGEAIQKIQSQMDAYHKNNIYNTSQVGIRDQIDKSPVNVVGLQTGSVHICTKKKPVNLAYISTQAAGKAQRALSGQDDLGTQSAGKSITAGITGVKTFQTAQKVTNTSIKIVRGAIKGRITITVAKKVIEQYANKPIRIDVTASIKTAKKVIVKGVKKGVPFVTFKVIPRTGKLILHSGIPTIAGALQGADDYAVQGVGHTLIGAQTAIKGIKTTPYVVKTAVKGGKRLYTTGKSVYTAGTFIKNYGLRAAWNAGRSRAARATVNAGKSIVTAIINAIKALGRKVIVPLIVVIIVVMAFSGVIMVPVTAVSSIFSSMFSTSDTNMDYDVREYLNTIVPTLSTNFQQDLADQTTNSRNSYHIVRFYSNTGSGDVIEPTLSGIASIFPTNEELLNMIQPIFNTAILMEYELEPTEAEAEMLTKKLFEKLFTVTTATSVEYCGQSLITGEGTVTTHNCGSVHASSDCPNTVTGTHSSYVCSDCCYYYCPGHDYNCEIEDCGGHTTYCSGCELDCNGYIYCGGHDVISYTLSLDGIYALEAEYFLEPIEELSNLSNPTDEEKERLAELQDYHEIFVEMMSQVSVNYGGGLNVSGLSNVMFINGTRKKNQDVINLALSQVGQTGGQPYWSYYGFSSRVEWCACFVHWCMRHTPSASSSYPTTSNNAYCQTVANNFKSIGQWGDKTYTNLVAGDVIFFDWQGDGHTDHIGLVIGTDGINVYTVEGNSGDAVKVKSYPVGTNVIYGYGLMNY